MLRKVFLLIILIISIKERKRAKVRNRYNEVPHLTQDTILESDKTLDTSYTRVARGQHFFQQVTTRLQEKTRSTKQNNKKDLQKEASLETVSKKVSGGRQKENSDIFQEGVIYHSRADYNKACCSVVDLLFCIPPIVGGG